MTASIASPTLALTRKGVLLSHRLEEHILGTPLHQLARLQHTPSAVADLAEIEASLGRCLARVRAAKILHEKDLP